MHCLLDHEHLPVIGYNVQVYLCIGVKPIRGRPLLPSVAAHTAIESSGSTPPLTAGHNMAKYPHLLYSAVTTHWVRSHRPSCY